MIPSPFLFLFTETLSSVEKRKIGREEGWGNIRHVKFAAKKLIISTLPFLFVQTHFILPEYLMQKDQRLDLDDARDKLKQAGVAEDEMAALERQLAPTTTTAKDSSRKVGFVSAGIESQSDGGVKVTANHEEIELPEESDSDDDEKVEIAQKDVPDAVFGGLIRKRDDEAEKDGEEQNGAATKDRDDDSRLGALERIKRQKRGA